MIEFDNQDVIRSIRSAGTGGPAFAMTPLAETTRRGRAARRRRSILAGAGTAALAAATITAALAVPPLLNTPDAGPPAADTDPTQEPTEVADTAIPMTANELIAAHKDAVFDSLPEGFVRVADGNLSDGFADFAVAHDAPATDGLPDGMGGGISLMTFQGDEPVESTGGDRWCAARTEKGSITSECVDVQVENEIVQVQETSQPGSESRGAWELTRTTYDRPNGDRITIDLYAWEKEITSEARTEQARAWVDAMHEQIVALVLHPSFQPTEWDELRTAEAHDLAADLGEQWTVLDEPPAASVHPTDELAATLPEQTYTGVIRDVLRNADLSELCAARVEDGMQRAACEPAPGGDAGVVVSYGLMVDPQHRGDDSHDMRLADVVVYYEHGDGTVVRAQVPVAHFGASDRPDPSGLRSWLADRVPDLVRAATGLG